MTIVKNKYFFGFLNRQEIWLNEMGKNGYRLIRAGKIQYEFEKTDDVYEYKVQFIAQKSRKNADDYMDFLKSLDYDVFTKNINLNYSFGKVKLRPYAEAGGKIVHSGNTYNRELLIIGKVSDGTPLEIHTTIEDLIDYYKPIRNAWLTIVSMAIILTISFWIKDRSIPYEPILFGIVSAIPSMLYQSKISKLKNDSIIIE